MGVIGIFFVWYCDWFPLSDYLGSGFVLGVCRPTRWPTGRADGQGGRCPGGRVPSWVSGCIVMFIWRAVSSHDLGQTMKGGVWWREVRQVALRGLSYMIFHFYLALCKDMTVMKLLDFTVMVTGNTMWAVALCKKCRIWRTFKDCMWPISSLMGETTKSLNYLLGWSITEVHRHGN